jgi:hypothetical protein
MAQFAAVAGLISAIAGIGTAVVSATSKPPAAMAALPVATRDDAAAMAQQDDDLRQRRGAAADILTGTGGAEAGAGAKFVAGS